MLAYSTEQTDPRHSRRSRCTVGCGCALDTAHSPRISRDKDPGTCGWYKPCPADNPSWPHILDGSWAASRSFLADKNSRNGRRWLLVGCCWVHKGWGRRDRHKWLVQWLNIKNVLNKIIFIIFNGCIPHKLYKNHQNQNWGKYLYLMEDNLSEEIHFWLKDLNICRNYTKICLRTQFEIKNFVL